MSRTATLHKAKEKGPAFAGPGLPSTTDPYITWTRQWLRKGHTRRKTLRFRKQNVDASFEAHSRLRHLPVIQEAECETIPEQSEMAAQ
jgi:hypothetical protein